MSAIFNGLKAAQRLQAANPMLFQHVARGMAGWNKDYKPAQIPKTEKDCTAAAKKYYLLPEEYRPYADNGLGYGDYPDLGKGLGIESKDPYYPYDFPEHKRNLHETLHADIDLYGEDRFSQAEKPRFTNSQYWLSFVGVMSGCLALYYWLENYRMYRPVAVKQYPGDGRKHYTFESE
ncbi:NADH dehydrogenase [ubiquinone] 1 beta subcomplex subunit 8, mitochondrial [Bactrocera neohumeralis]|uniref:NADH dehydrogenase [ubiquinone] 1 beta subcomplex subunit 8, mitochondrial-like n=1 Tax=Bactrocera tryoni TaxID=59916 RepID=UPI001A99BCCF|nr:NADH dehydrogenase [ubiquinone] 1 beta subcomplex subunit 8, mitochondrial-like [Bactrocera tryoni]XP_050330260.1 NADH dehydrogenase [ubiquinone] 1 beta subcomplex subunit 8, mitochondrial [Bactrocera neohumeralis]